jgi:DNA repair exonuclease SbcCD ATPase subunit
MSDDYEDDDGDEHDHGYSPPQAADPVLIALQLCQLASNPKTIAVAIKKLRRLDRQFADTQAKVAALTTEAERTEAALTERVAELDARERALDDREAKFESQAEDVRDELREHHARLEQTNRRLIHRIMVTAGISWNENLQELPSWEQLRQLIVDLPPDLPAPHTARTEVISQDVREDWSGNVFVPGSTLTRSISHKATS